ncbi:type II CRISPR-associated endonuclease Cas1 [Apilactobacillus sp. TMW 2.2459]|nr:type II CRISPR-associated endonuclease Cas1 [Apilactobacillus xinyiensis]
MSQKQNFSIPLNDINTLIIDNTSCIITTSTIAKLAKHKVAVFICDEKHIPCSINLPFANYYQKLSILESQFKMRKKTKGRIWQKIIKQKIYNQAQNIRNVDKSVYNTMMKISKQVDEYDKNYCEANAARIYFKILFDDDFTRRDENIVNGSLNYGYSLVRGIICREICAIGLEPSLAIFHHNKLNSFNLADDLIEPFRGLIDKWILKKCLLKDYVDIDKTNILKLLYCDILIDEQKQSLSNAVKIMVASYKKCCVKNSSSGLILPQQIIMQAHEYK